MKRPRQSCDLLRAQLAAAITSGDTAKECACRFQLSMSWTYRLLQDLGFTCVLLSKEERALIETRRAERRAGKLAA